VFGTASQNNAKRGQADRYWKTMIEKVKQCQFFRSGGMTAFGTRRGGAVESEMS
jgi:hypothetical protein